MQTPRPDLFTYPPHGYPAEKARQGEIILKRSWIRAVFIGGVVGVVILGFALSLTT